MAESEIPVVAEPVDPLSELKKDLEGWREALLPLNGLLTWEKPYHPGILVGVTTFIFALVWYFEPSLLTTLALMGLVITAVDFTVPLIGPSLFGSRPWTVTEERQFEEICQRILNLRGHFSSFVEGLATLKAEKPKVYFLVVMGVLALFGWIGCIVDNLFLTFIIVLVALMVPGLRKHGIIQKYLLKYWLIVKKLLFGRMQVNPKKTN
ncbi:ADP-ribosylation factor-like protein 6-interacting protein 1 isoform X1 [Pomacea canaliculata]|uniref:ADP-ribosylation factor-like protein 6-interacting protein 1 isoform X1 n=1 Tax=Pomacea canaliculata TaxID=400727 RepID=UPI000D734C1D|nr:ADP-ribosylation factor-like protein 6-interacting protein 1 isoform X1 [Pomacea canaliculata]